MNYSSLSRDLWLLQNFKNGWEMVKYIRKPHPIDKVTLWNGQEIYHPQCKGLVEALIEIWHENIYLAHDIASQIKDGDVILDVGANVGLFSIQYAKLKPNTKIISLEPFPVNFQCLQKNLDSFKIKNVESYELGLSILGGERQMISVGDRSLDHRMLSAENQSDKSDSAEQSKNQLKFQIRSISLEQVFSMFKIQEIALIKMDIEGGENEIFASITKDSLEKIRCLAIEYHDNIVPNTLKLITDKLSETHTLITEPSLLGCGILYAFRK
jgi:FkbM family methyltransferase